MEEFIAKMSEKVGISKETAEKVMEFMKDHADEAVTYLKDSDLLERLPGGIGGKIKDLF